MNDHRTTEPEDIITFALTAVREGHPDQFARLDTLPAPVYATDAEGRLTYYNQACIGFAGRKPVTGVDHWCVTWKLYTTDGAELPHDQCPMAIAIREGRAIRGMEAVAQRPDGTHVHFQPFATPILDQAGKVIGGVNVLIDVARHRHLLTQAERCRRLAKGIDDRSTKQTLMLMANNYEEQARAISSVESPSVS